MIAIALALALSGDPYASARAGIDRFCQGKPEGCVAEQRRQLGHFVVMMAAFRDPADRNAERCTRSGKVGRHVDWVKAAGCLRSAVKGRRLGG